MYTEVNCNLNEVAMKTFWNSRLEIYHLNLNLHQTIAVAEAVILLNDYKVNLEDL